MANTKCASEIRYATYYLNVGKFGNINFFYIGLLEHLPSAEKVAFSNQQSLFSALKAAFLSQRSLSSAQRVAF